ncbi:hypothetical protein SAMN04488574_11076 [Bacillus sp. 71mf]|nr:hypothetical protein SAMN04488574_11076 [Bacillus sp. 71mf]SFT01684.1 hypothetical protein SAMN04488145_10760 [Bacillus sp. 103mf]
MVKTVLEYTLLIINFLLLTPLLTRMVDRIGEWDAISFVCPLISVLAINILLRKNRVKTIHWKVNFIGHIVIGVTPIIYLVYIFILL